MRKLILKTSPIGMFMVIKPRLIGIFVLIWNIIFGSVFLINRFHPFKYQNPSLLLVILAGAYGAYAGLAPLSSKSIRQRWCRQNSDFDDARFGLILLSAIGSLIGICGVGILLGT